MENIVAISIMVVGGVLLAIIVSAICGNRKLRRHKECCRKSPHIPGMETNKTLRQEIERRVQRLSEIRFEPLLLCPDLHAPASEQQQYYCRMKALDHLCYLERELSRLPGVQSRLQHESLRGFLLRLTLGTGPPSGVAVLHGLEPRLLHQLCDQHAHARYHAHPFTRHHLSTTHALMLRVLHYGRTGGKGLGSDDYLVKAPSDHDSAIDADPLELEPSDDEYHQYRQQQYPQHQQQFTAASSLFASAAADASPFSHRLIPGIKTSGGAFSGSGGGDSNAAPVTSSGGVSSVVPKTAGGGGTSSTTTAAATTTTTTTSTSTSTTTPGRLSNRTVFNTAVLRPSSAGLVSSSTDARLLSGAGTYPGSSVGPVCASGPASLPRGDGGKARRAKKQRPAQLRIVGGDSEDGAG